MQYAVQAPPYAGFWRRVLAFLIDALLVGAVTSFLDALLHISYVPSFTTGDNGVPVFHYPAGYYSGSGLNTLVWLAYYTLMESSQLQGTVGKLVLGLVVTDRNGQRLSIVHALARNLAKYISALICFIGFLMVAFTQRKQGLHDLIAGTLVLRKEAVPLIAGYGPQGGYPPPGYEPPPAPGQMPTAPYQPPPPPTAYQPPPPPTAYQPPPPPTAYQPPPPASPPSQPPPPAPSTEPPASPPPIEPPTGS